MPSTEPPATGLFVPRQSNSSAQTPELFGGEGGCLDGGKGGCFDGGKGDKSGKGGCLDGGMGDKSGSRPWQGAAAAGPYGKAQQQQELIKQLLQQQKQSQEREQALERRAYDLEGQVTHVVGQVRWMLNTLDRVMPLSDSGSGH
jgi:hypothetical protein